MIVVAVPVLERPHRAQPLADSLAASGADARLVFVCSPFDPPQIRACRETGADVLVLPEPPRAGDYARKVNLVFRLSAEPWLFTGADDLEFEPGWDVEALAVAEQTGAGVVGTNDDANPLVRRGGHATHSLVRRAYVDEHGGTVDAPGLVFSEAYGHQWCDNELVEVAKARGTWAFAERAVVRHRHPIFDRGVPDDATYRRGSATARQDARLFQVRRRRWRHVAHVPPYGVDSGATQSAPAPIASAGG